jgi:hypothetical protein
LKKIFFSLRTEKKVNFDKMFTNEDSKTEKFSEENGMF